MKKTLLMSALSIALMFLIKPASAQISSVSITNFDSLTVYCSVPSPVLIMVEASASGTMTTSDSLYYYINFDDGSDTSFTTVASTSSFIYLYHYYTFPGTFTPYDYLTATGGAANSYHDYGFSISDTCSGVNGKLYMDGNHNCTPDLGEIGLAYMPILVANPTTHDTTIAGWTNDTGYYSFVMPTSGTYGVIANPDLYLSWYYYYTDSNIAPECPVGGTASVAVSGGTTTTQNFADTCANPDSLDVSAYGWTDCFTPGDTSYIEVWMGNWWWYYGFICTAESNTVTLTLDPKLTYAGALWGTPPTSVSGSTVTWDYTSMSNYFYMYSYIMVVTSTTASIGDTLCSTLYASPTALPDPNLTNNTTTICHTVTSSHDPNGKSVSPEGSDVPGYIDNGTPLSYNIHFQNNGTAAATNVTVIDTLSANLDVKTLHILQSSAPVQIYTSGNIVKFRFNNINLPDSASNEWGSIGSISYAILPNAGLAPGTQIWNNAKIFFDYNPPIVTNSTLNTIKLISTGVENVHVQGFEAKVYPNPADNMVSAVSADKSDFTMTVVDLLGRTISSSKSVTGTANFSTANLPDGIYIVKLTNNAGKENTTKLSIEH